MAKSKLSFTLDGIKYTDISGYSYDGDSRSTFNVNVAGTAQMIRQYMKQKYPNIPARNYYSVQSQSYSGGDSITVYLYGAPEELFIKLNKELNDKFEEGKFDGMTDSYTYTKSAEKSEEGRVIDYGTKYLFVNNNRSNSDGGSADWDAVLSAKPTSASSSPAPTRERKSYPMGEVLKDCAGWIIYKKTLPDGRIVYNAKIKPDTAPNRTDWAAIKGEVYTDTGFKWGKFGAFEKWGVIASEAAVIDILCKILGKYYDGTEVPKSETPAPEPTPAPAPEPQSEDSVGIYVNGEFIDNVSSQEKAYEILKNNFGAAKFQEMIDNNQAYYNMSTKRVNVIRDSYVYGKKWGVPAKYGNELQFAFIEKGFKVYVSAKTNVLVIYKKYMANDGMIINDNGGEFNLDRYGYNENIGSVNYEMDKKPNSVSTLANLISEIYDDFFQDTEEQKTWGVGYVYETQVKDLPNQKFIITAITSDDMVEVSPYDNRETVFKPYTVKEFNTLVENGIIKILGRDKSTQPTKTKEDIEKAIRGLQYLADKGNEKAIKAIKGLQYLLNK